MNSKFSPSRVSKEESLELKAHIEDCAVLFPDVDLHAGGADSKHPASVLTNAITKSLKQTVSSSADLSSE